MPPPYDTVISIGGQSLVDGIWRLLGPALEGLTNPLPLALPGFSSATMRITRITPVFPGTPPATGALGILATLELNAEALLKVNVSGEDIRVTLGPQNLHLTNLTGTIGLPAQTGSLSDINIGGDFPAPIGHVNLGPGTGSLDLEESTASLTGDLRARLNLPLDLTVPTIPFPAFVPIAVDLTPAPLVATAALTLTVSGINPTTRFGLLFNVSEVSVANITLDPSLPTNLVTTFGNAINQIVQQLGMPITHTPISVGTMSTLLAPLPRLVQQALDDALTRLLAETGRLIYPPAGSGSSCDIAVLPTAGDAQLVVVGSDNTYVLQIGFNRTSTSSTAITGFPPFTPAGIADTTLLVGNLFLLELLCCLVERLPAFTLPTAATSMTTDVNGTTHVMCCNFTGATLDLGPIALTGGLSLCLDGMSGSTKTFTLVGTFTQSTLIANITVGFTLPLTFDLDDVASLANLRVFGTLTPPTVSVTPNPWLLATLAVVGFLFIGPAVGATAALLVFAACATATSLLNNSVNTVLRAASLVRSPVSVPPGVFEAFGKLVPVTVMIDDLTAHSVLQTPTAPWALLPRIGLGGRSPVNPDQPQTSSHL